jgi:hypothetical protein
VWPCGSWRAAPLLEIQTPAADHTLQYPKKPWEVTDTQETPISQEQEGPRPQSVSLAILSSNYFPESGFPAFLLAKPTSLQLKAAPFSYSFLPNHPRITCGEDAG